MSKKRGQAESVRKKVSRVYGHSFVGKHAAGKKRCQQRWYGIVYLDRDGLHGRCPLTKTNHKCNRDENHTSTWYLRGNEHICACGIRFIPWRCSIVEEVNKVEIPPVKKKVSKVKRVKYPVKPKENK